jgi:hypothetical protein
MTEQDTATSSALQKESAQDMKEMVDELMEGAEGTDTKQEEATPEEQTPEKVEAEVVKDKFMITDTGVMLVGHDHLGEKMTAIICELFRRQHNKTRTTALMFRVDGYPAEHLGMAYADTFSAAINLSECWEQAKKTAENDKDMALSVAAIAWLNIFVATAHELNHLEIAGKLPEDFAELMATEEGRKELDSIADDDCTKDLIAMAKAVDMEIPKIEGLGWLGTKLQELFTSPDTAELPWVIRSRKMVETGYIYDDPENPMARSKSFRQFINLAYDRDGDWEQTVAPVSMTAYGADGSKTVYKVDPVPQPEVKASDNEALFGSPYGNSGTVPAGNSTPTADAGGVDAFGNPVGGGYKPVPPANTAPNTPPSANAGAGTDANIEKITGCLRDIWLRLHHHVFTKCGWGPGEGGFNFTNPAGILEPVNIQDTLAAYGEVVSVSEYQTLNASGQECTEPFQGFVRGHIFKKSGLPSYTISFNIGGQAIKRVMVPQNTRKASTPAAEARNGVAIAWVIRHGQAENQFAAKITNGNYEAL